MDAERVGWASQNNVGAFDSALKLPGAGYHFEKTSSLSGAGNVGYYWTSSTNSTFVRILRTAVSSEYMTSTNRARGACVRCIKD